PLNSIIGFSGVLLQGLSGELSGEQQTQVQMINNSGKRLLDLINGILDLAKVESRQFSDPVVGPVDIADVAHEMFETVRPIAEAKGLEMRWSGGPDRSIRTDGQRVGQIVLNLIGNAAKFTSEGYIGVSITDDVAGIAIAVADSGCGIAPGDFAHLFDDFYQATPTDGGKAVGTGLGLAVSRRLAESIGARIEVASKPGQGSLFTLHVPDLRA
ncbi:MAG: HAMP domain-containing sensor histidine kinase, partial [Coriobacteriia bacterium]|nr:HAMP domain-containing sensor histidine kinase [Coriobacteriia bacterium]